MSYNLKFSRYGERAILIEWPEIIDEKILKDILNFKNSIKNYIIKQKVEIINTYNSILINYNLTIDNINDEISSLKTIYNEQNEVESTNASIWEIPVCYNTDFGQDLEDFSNQKKLSKSEIIELHSNEIYTVYFIGFLPGFLYLGGLHPKLYLDRKSTPNLNIKKGSVAIGGQQTGIYPQNSPGGWHIIGRTPIELFVPSQNPPCFIKAGDKVKFRPIEESEYLDIENRMSKSAYQLKPIKQNA
ncbi:5-oxoprolinase subunit PxpB [Winogradskyella ouciana]|uniref:5-oxoprolinase subunit PxpB n=1 Tax=Winogradskyella ouciana TaxID=2608631 RepID=A0A7K1GAL3_9FLAO|nr:5-oxoprolinase subunit PxpB [Winogradskyella ouciana]MTE25428.1 5-oxoprolinase subunit PxpB [Winogradskyella ouciana]